MFTLRATKKLADRLKQPVVTVPPPPTARLGDWYGNVLLWRPQVAVFINESTFFPIFMPLAPAATVLHRFPETFIQTMDAFGVDPAFIAAEVPELVSVTIAKTSDRQVLGVMKELTFMAETRVVHGFDPADLVGLSIRVADTLVSPLYKPADGSGTPDRALRRRVAALMAAG